MRIVFMGTPDFAVPSLRALLDNGYRVVGVFCQPDAADDLRMGDGVQRRFALRCRKGTVCQQAAVQ